MTTQLKHALTLDSKKSHPNNSKFKKMSPLSNNTNGANLLPSLPPLKQKRKNSSNCNNSVNNVNNNSKNSVKAIKLSSKATANIKWNKINYSSSAPSTVAAAASSKSSRDESIDAPAQSVTSSNIPSLQEINPNDLISLVAPFTIPDSCILNDLKYNSSITLDLLYTGGTSCGDNNASTKKFKSSLEISKLKLINSLIHSLALLNALPAKDENNTRQLPSSSASSSSLNLIY